MIRDANFIPIKQWLNDHVHFQGSKKTTAELLNDLAISYDPIDFINAI